MQLPQLLTRETKHSIIIHLFVILGAFILFNTLNDPGSKAEVDKKVLMSPVQPGVFIGKNNQYPVFTMGSKVFAPKDIPLNKDALISFSFNIREGVPEEVIKKAIEGQKKGLHLLFELTEEEIKSEDLPKILENISQHNLTFWVSLIPLKELPQKEYDDFYKKIRSHLSDADVKNISLVWYPSIPLETYQAAEDWVEMVDRVGINISGLGDLAKFDSIYKMFADKKAIIINENIIDTHRQDIKNGLDFLKLFYYSLAFKYPAVTAVYQSSDLRFAEIKYHKTIEGLKHRSWATNSKLENSNQPMFELLKGNTVLTDQVEFLYRPQDDNYQNIALVEYKFNTETIIQAQRPPFDIRVDTNKLHNGINSLIAVVYNKQLKIINKHHIYFEVGNKNIPPRAKRLATSYGKDHKPIYTSSYIPVLMYHDFALEVSSERASIAVTADLFEKQLKALLDYGYTPVTFYDLNRFLDKKAGLPSKPVIITTDDGYLSNYTIAYPLLKKYGIPATFFVTTSFMGVNTQFPHITWTQGKEMENSGLVDIQSHTHKHRLLSQLSKNDALYETSISFGLIEKYLGKRDIKVLSYPEFRNTADNRKWFNGQGIDLQITDLATKQSVTTKQNVQRIHVHNNMTPKNLINTIEHLTM